MKSIWKYLAIGLLTAVAGLYASQLAGHFFTGMDYGSACVLGICLYLCGVVVTCTGIIVEKLRESQRSGETRQAQSEIE